MFDIIVAPSCRMSTEKVLSVKKEPFSPVLHSAERGENIFLTKFPFYVGNMPDYMDYVIDRDTVSRFHAKFIKQGEQIYLMDLNSMNGTRVNGREINVRDQILLFDGDRILFADAEYIFSEKDREEKGDFSARQSKIRLEGIGKNGYTG